MEEWENPLGVLWDTRPRDGGGVSRLARARERIADVLLVECTNEREAAWPLLVPLPPRRIRARWDSVDASRDVRLRFALAPKPLAGALLSSMLVSALAPAATLAGGNSKQPTINLPPASAGTSDGEDDDAAAGQVADEDQSEPADAPAASPAPAAPPAPAATPEVTAPAPAPAPAATPEATGPAPAQTPEPAVTTGDGAPGGEPAPAAPEPASAEAPAISPADAPEAVAAPAATPVATLPAPLTEAPAPRRATRAARHRHRRPARSVLVRPAANPAPVSAAAGTIASARAVVPLRHLHHLLGGRSHDVRTGETLWTIAAAMLPAGASDTQVGALVDRIWKLNAQRIGTGDPDVLPVAVTLRLPSLDTDGGSR